jgi:hypothetical protein
MSVNFVQQIGFVDDGGVQPEKLISRASLQGGGVIEDGFVINYEGFFRECRLRYQELRNATATVTINVCHASCHRSCHGSRSRR